MMNQHALNEITRLSGPAATNNEYQVHYSSLVYQVSEGEQTLNISVPLVFFNYKQEVSSASISFELTDVTEASKAIEPLVVAKAQELMATPFHAYIMEQFPTAEAIIAPMQQIHRHPGRLAAFSGTDLDRNPESPGICFPFLKAGAKTPSFGSIIAHQRGITELIHNEYRQVQGDVESEDGIEYLHGRSFTYIKGYEIEPEQGFIGMFQEQADEEPDYIHANGLEANKMGNDVQLIMDEYKDIDFEPSVDLVIPENVTEKKYGYAGYSRGPMGYTHPTRKVPAVTEPINKYGKNANKSLLEVMQEEIDAEEKAKAAGKPKKKTDEEMIQEALILQEIERDEPIKDMEIMNDMDGGFPCSMEAMDAKEIKEFAEQLRDDLEFEGVDRQYVDLASDAKIYEWAFAINMLVNVDEIVVDEEPEAETKSDTFAEFK